MKKFASHASQKMCLLQGRSVDFHEDTSRAVIKWTYSFASVNWSKAGQCRSRVNHAASL